MALNANSKPNDPSPPPRLPAITPQGRENQLISLAVDLAEKQLIEGTATSPVITHFLKLGTERAHLERVKLERENQLLAIKTESIASQKDAEAVAERALRAFKEYSGND